MPKTQNQNHSAATDGGSTANPARRQQPKALLRRLCKGSEGGKLADLNLSQQVLSREIVPSLNLWDPLPNQVTSMTWVQNVDEADPVTTESSQQQLI